MPKRVVRLINRNPGISGVITAILFIAPSYALWYHENNQTNEAVECVVDSFTTRDIVTKDSRQSLNGFFVEFRSFLVHIAEQTNVDPLVNSIDEFLADSRGVTLVVKASDLEACLGD